MFKKFLGVTAVTVLVSSAFGLGAFGDDVNNKATITSIKNIVELKYGESNWRTGSLNQLIRPGTKIRTGALSSVEIMYPDGTITRVGSRTVLTVADKEIKELNVSTGNIWFKVTKKSSGLKVRAPKALAAIMGTEGGMRVDLLDKNEEMEQFSSNNSLRLASILNSLPFRIAETGDANVTFGLVDGNANFSTDGGYNQDMTGGDMVSFSSSDPNNVNYQTGLDNNFIQGQFEASNTGNDDNTGGGNQGGNTGGSNTGVDNTGGNFENNQGGNTGGGNTGGNNNSGVQNQDLNPSNPVTNLEDKNKVDPTKNQETTPVTGTLELIIK